MADEKENIIKSPRNVTITFTAKLTPEGKLMLSRLENMKLRTELILANERQKRTADWLRGERDRNTSLAQMLQSECEKGREAERKLTAETYLRRSYMESWHSAKDEIAQLIDCSRKTIETFKAREAAALKLADEMKNVADQLAADNMEAMFAADAQEARITELEAVRRAQASELSRLSQLSVNQDAAFKMVARRNDELVDECYRHVQAKERAQAYSEALGAFVHGNPFRMMPLDHTASLNKLVTNQRDTIIRLHAENEKQERYICKLDAALREANAAHQTKLDAVRARHNKATVHVMLLKREVARLTPIEKEYKVALVNISEFERLYNERNTQRNIAVANETRYEVGFNKLWQIVFGDTPQVQDLGGCYDKLIAAFNLKDDLLAKHQEGLTLLVKKALKGANLPPAPERYSELDAQFDQQERIMTRIGNDYSEQSQRNADLRRRCESLEQDTRYVYDQLRKVLAFQPEGEKLENPRRHSSASNYLLAVNQAVACINRLRDDRAHRAQTIMDLTAENASLLERAKLNDGSAWRAEVERQSGLMRAQEMTLEQERSLRSKAQTIIQYITGMMGEIDLTGVKGIFDAFQQASGGEYSYSFDELVRKLREYLKSKGCVDTHTGYGRGEMVVKRPKLHHYAGHVETQLTFNDGSKMNLTGAQVSDPEIAAPRFEFVPKGTPNFDNKFVNKVTMSEADITYSCGCTHKYARGAQVAATCFNTTHKDGTNKAGYPVKGTYR